jgi:anti-anti-sigma factor
MSAQQLSVPTSLRPEREPLLSFDLAGRGSVTVITMSGEVDLSTMHLLTELVQHVVGDHPARVELDMSRVRFFGADGIRALLEAREMITAAGGQLVLRAPSAVTWRLLTLTGTDKVFPLAADPG